MSSVPLGQELWHQYAWAKNSVFSTPRARTLSSVPLGQELCLQYPWAKNSVFSTPGPRRLSSVPLGQELCHQYPWAKNSVIGTPGPRTLSSVPLGGELCHQYPWAKNSVFSSPRPRTLSSVPLGQELCLVSAANPHLLRISQICPRLATFWPFSLLRRNRCPAAQSQDQTYIFLMCRIRLRGPFIVNSPRSDHLPGVRKSAFPLL